MSQATELIAKQAGTGTNLSKIWNGLIVNVKDTAFGAKGDETADDTEAIQRAIDSLPSGIFSGGTVWLPDGHYKITAPIRLKSGVKLVGSSTRATRIAAYGDNYAMIECEGVIRASIDNIMLDGQRNTGIKAISITGTSGDMTVSNLWIDSVSTAIYTNDSYNIHFDRLRIMGTPLGFDLTAASNNIVMTTCCMVCTGIGMNWYNSSSLTVQGCAFEGESPVNIYACQGAMFQGNYFESDDPHISYWLNLGNGVGGKAEGITIAGNLFNYGANYGVMVQGAEGVVIEGNYFATILSAFRWLQYDDSQKRGIKIGNNSYNINLEGYDASKVLIKEGSNPAKPLNDNMNQEVIGPMLLYSTVEPPSASLANGQAALFWNGTQLILMVKDNTGTISYKNITT